MQHVEKIYELLSYGDRHFQILQAGISKQTLWQMKKVHNVDCNYFSFGELVLEMYCAIYRMKPKELGLLMWGAECGYLTGNMARDYLGPMKKGGQRYMGYQKRRTIFYNFERNGWIKEYKRNPLIYTYTRDFSSFAKRFYGHLNKLNEISLSQNDTKHDFFKDPHNRWRIHQFNKSVSIIAGNRNASKELLKKIETGDMRARMLPIELRKVQLGDY